MIKTEQLYYLVQIAKYNSITSAAKELYLTKAAVSTAMKQLEKECGFEILERSYHGVKFTPQGERVLEYARQILLLLEEIPKISVDIKQPSLERKNLYIEKSLMPLLQNKLILPNRGIIEHYNLYEVPDHTDVQAQVDDDNLLLAIRQNDELSALEREEGLIIKELFHSRYYPVSSKRSRWVSSNTNRITIAEYRQLPKVALSNQDNLASYYHENIVLQTENSNVYVNAVLNDVGLGMMTDFAEDLFMENRKLLQVYEPLDDTIAHIILVMRNSGDLTRADLIEQALKRS